MKDLLLLSQAHMLDRGFLERVCSWMNRTHEGRLELKTARAVDCRDELKRPILGAIIRKH
jgi:hypothetical protein